MRAAAAAGGVSGVGVDEAVALAPKREPGRIEGAFEIARAVRAKVNGAIGDVAAYVVGDTQGEIVAVYEGDIVVVVTVCGAQCPLGEGGWGDTGTGVRVAGETTIAATVGARIRAGVGGEVAVPASPDTTGLPVIGDSERLRTPSSCFPTSRNSGSSAPDVQISEHGRPDGERASIVHGERAC
jgi:hypothetical protein